MLITTNGLVIRSYTSGNSDRVIHILTLDHGLLSVLVKGGGSKKGGADPAIQLFSYSNFELYQGKTGDLYWYRGGSVNNSFYNVTSDITNMALASYLCDLTGAFFPEESPEDASAPLLRMLLNSLYVLDNQQKPPALVKPVFELRSACLMGYEPDLGGCTVCGEANPENAYIDVMNGRFICESCHAVQSRSIPDKVRQDEQRLGRVICPVTGSVLAAVRYILAAPDKKVFSFSMKDAEEERALGRIAETYLLNQLEQDFDTLHFYRTVAD